LTGRLASIDIGSNSALLLIAERDGGLLEPVLQKVVVPRVGRNLANTGLISEEAFSLLMDGLKGFQREIEISGACLVGAVATQAFRMANNGAELLAKVSEQLHLDVKIIAGPEESRLGYLAVVNRHPSDSLMVLDIGGGSTEVTRKGQGMSVPLGAVSLLEAGGGNPEACRQHAERIFKPVLGDWPKGMDIVAVGGTATALAMLELKLPTFDSNAIEGLELGIATVSDYIDTLNTLSETERARLPGMDQGRMDILVPGLCILEAILRQFESPSFRISDRGIRYGVILDWLKQQQVYTKRVLP
jgi:exopolyphosphatase / guanosine-5'-triphosphate,3'-diphosphate pyrophosphatase